MQGHYYKPNCKCVDSEGKSKNRKRCNCGATWSYMVDKGKKPTGGRDQKKKGGFATKTDAETAAAIFIADLTRGTHVTEANVNFKDFSAIWMKAYSEKGEVKITTIRVRKLELKRLMPFFEFLKMKDITLDQYQGALNELRKKLSDSTMDGTHSTGRAIFKYAIALKKIKEDPTEHAYVPKVKKTVEEIELEKRSIKYLEKEELSLLLKTALDRGLKGDYEMFTILSYSGLRDGELCVLKKSDFNRSDFTLGVSRTIYTENNNTANYQLLTPKTKKSRRDVVMEPFIFDMVDIFLEKQEEYKNQLNNWLEEDYIFTSKKHHGYPMIVKTVERRFKRLLKLAGLNEDLTPHSLRHTHVSLLAEAGVDLIDIQDRLGHEDDDTTKFIYLHVTKPKKLEASNKFGELMRSI